jgi:hypothetical protein
MNRSILLTVATLLVLAVALAARPAASLEGMRCKHTPECTTSEGEICIADPLTSTWGTCRRVKVLP